MATTQTTVSRRAALSAVLLSALVAASANAATAKDDYKPKFTWWAILIMMIGIVVVFTVALLVYFCVFRKEGVDEKTLPHDDAVSEESPAVPAAGPSHQEKREPAHKSKGYPME